MATSNKSKTKEFPNQQHCPTCNHYVKPNKAYPNYVCSRCKNQAKDKSGELVVFLTITSTGNGCQGKYVESEKLYRSNTCYIKGIKCKAEETPDGIIISAVNKRNSKASEKV